MAVSSAVPGGPLPLLALGVGLTRSARRWPLALALYLPSLLLGLLSAAPVTVAASTATTRGPWIQLAAEGGIPEVMLEIGNATQASRLLPGAGAPSDLSQAGLLAFGGIVLGLFGLLVHGVAYTFLSGGVLSGLAGGVAFWPECRRWFWPLARLALLGFVVLVFVGGAGVVVVSWLLPTPNATSVLVQALLGVLWLAMVNGYLELARAELVLGGAGRSALRALGRAARPGRLLDGLVVWILLGVLSAIFWSIAGPLLLMVPATAIVGAVLVQQAVAFASAWLKLLRLGAASALVTVHSVST